MPLWKNTFPPLRNKPFYRQHYFQFQIKLNIFMTKRLIWECFPVITFPPGLKFDSLVSTLFSPSHPWQRRCFIWQTKWSHLKWIRPRADFTAVGFIRRKVWKMCGCESTWKKSHSLLAIFVISSLYFMWVFWPLYFFNKFKSDVSFHHF